jgi:hypothetical protein
MEIDCLQRNATFKFKITLDRHNARQNLFYCVLPLSTKIPLTLLLLQQTGCVDATNRSPKNVGSIHLRVCLEVGLVSPKRVGILVAQHFGGFFHQMCASEYCTKTGFYTSHLPKNEEIEGLFVFSGSEL